MPEDDSSLTHYGVKGMRWGVRRSDAQLARSRKESSDYKEFTSNRKRSNSELSNKELKKVNERLQLEKTNQELTSKGGIRKIKNGTAAVGALVAVGTLGSTMYNLAKSPAAKAATTKGKQVINLYIKGQKQLTTG